MTNANLPKTRTFIVDSFTREPFRGNPAAVCICGKAASEERMGRIAAELNLSETAFVVWEPNKPSAMDIPIRYFSPKMEIPLCGHATLAAAKVVLDLAQRNLVTFVTMHGVKLEVVRDGRHIQMRFPAYDLEESRAPRALLDALGLAEVEYCGFNRETQILMLDISDSRLLRELKPDFDALLASHNAIQGVSVTAKADDDFDFHSRYFWPWSGSNEDPVTGGTHTFLTKYWSQKLGKTRLRSFQASERTGEMEVELLSHDSILILGEAVSVLEGNLLV